MNDLYYIDQLAEHDKLVGHKQWIC